MNIDKFTIKAQEVIQNSASSAQEYQRSIIETGDLLNAVLQSDESLISFLCRKVGVNQETLENETKNLVQFYGKSSGANPYFSNDSHSVISRAEKSVKKFKDDFVAVEHILLGLVGGKDRTTKILKNQGFTEKYLIKAIREMRGGRTVNDQHAEEKYRSLERYSQNLTELAKAGKIDPVIGRDDEIRRLLQILSRRTKNNPLLIGEPGVGKTAIAEGLAQRIVNGDAPENLKHISIVSLDMGLLVAGAKYKGEFEERLKSVIKEVIDSEGEIVLFIDEMHTLIGTGSGGDSAMDAANLLKPALARGELRAIGATTLKEYQKHIEKDKALERRFQTIMVNEPSVSDSISILRGIKEKYELHHGVQIKDDALIAAAQLSDRYISDRFLPDKAIDLMDEATAKLRIEIDSMPEDLDEISRKIMQLEIEREAIRREKDTTKEKQLSVEIANLNETRDSLNVKWKDEKELLQDIKNQKGAIERYRFEVEQAKRDAAYEKVAELTYEKIPDSEQKLIELQEKLQSLARSGALLNDFVTAENIAEVVSKWTGIPVQKMLESDREKLLRLEDELSKRVAGQHEAIRAIADAVRRSRAGLHDPNRPVGSFIFLGTTGVGKTELAKTLADFLFNDENSMVRIDMSEYQERHAVSRLIGAPPGYVGYDEGGQLTEAVRRKPYSVILLDEIEKAHPDVFNILLQVLDDGRLTDNKGRIANFKNAIIIMTSNIGSDIIMERFGQMTEDNQDILFETTKEETFNQLKKSVRPEFLNRIDEVIMFTPLSENELEKVVQIQLALIQERLAANNIKLSYSSEIQRFLAKEGYDPQFGARPLKRTIQRLVLNQLSRDILAGKITKSVPIRLEVKDGKIAFLNA